MVAPGLGTYSFSDLFEEDTKKRLETIDPERRFWQLREFR